MGRYLKASHLTAVPIGRALQQVRESRLSDTDAVESTTFGPARSMTRDLLGSSAEPWIKVLLAMGFLPSMFSHHRENFSENPDSPNGAHLGAR